MTSLRFIIPFSTLCAFLCVGITGCVPAGFGSGQSKSAKIQALFRDFKAVPSAEACADVSDELASFDTQRLHDDVRGQGLWYEAALRHLINSGVIQARSDGSPNFNASLGLQRQWAAELLVKIKGFYDTGAVTPPPPCTFESEPSDLDQELADLPDSIRSERKNWICLAMREGLLQSVTRNTTPNNNTVSTMLMTFRPRAELSHGELFYAIGEILGLDHECNQGRGCWMGSTLVPAEGAKTMLLNDNQMLLNATTLQDNLTLNDDAAAERIIGPVALGLMPNDVEGKNTVDLTQPASKAVIYSASFLATRRNVCAVHRNYATTAPGDGQTTEPPSGQTLYTHLMMMGQ